MSERSCRLYSVVVRGTSAMQPQRPSPLRDTDPAEQMIQQQRDAYLVHGSTNLPLHDGRTFLWLPYCFPSVRHNCSANDRSPSPLPLIPTNRYLECQDIRRNCIYACMLRLVFRAPRRHTVIEGRETSAKTHVSGVFFLRIVVGTKRTKHSDTAVMG